MKTKSWKQFLTVTMTALFLLTVSVTTFAQGRPGGGQRPANAQRGQRPANAPQGQRPANAQQNRQNSPYADKYKNGQVKPPEARGQWGRP